MMQKNDNSSEVLSFIVADFSHDRQSLFITTDGTSTPCCFKR